MSASMRLDQAAWRLATEFFAGNPVECALAAAPAAAAATLIAGHLAAGRFSGFALAGKCPGFGAPAVTTGSPTMPDSSRGRLVTAGSTIIGWLDSVPYALLAVPLRFAVATVFWNSAMAHLANWDTTLYLFATDYRLPFLPSVPATYLTIVIELSAPVLLVIGLLIRPTALVLLGMTTVIEVFIYPLAWPTHIQWAAMMLVLLCRGGGALSLDAAIKRWLIPFAASLMAGKRWRGFFDLPLLHIGRRTAPIACGRGDRRHHPQPDQSGRRVAGGPIPQHSQAVADLPGALLRRHLRSRVVSAGAPAHREIKLRRPGCAAGSSGTSARRQTRRRSARRPAPIDMFKFGHRHLLRRGRTAPSSSRPTAEVKRLRKGNHDHNSRGPRQLPGLV